MKKIIFIFLTLTFISCNKEINCSGSDEKQVYFELLGEGFEKIYSDLKEKNDLDVIFDLPFEEVKEDFFDDVVKLEGMRPSKIEKELKKCECEAELTAQLPEKVTDYLLENLTDYYTFDEKELKEPYKWNNVKYNLQLTEDNKIYCETYKKNKLNQAFIDYAYFVNMINNHKNGKFENLTSENTNELTLIYDGFEFGDLPHYIFKNDKGEWVDFTSVENDTYDLALESSEGYTTNEKYKGKKFVIEYRTEESNSGDLTYEDKIITKLQLIE